MASLFALLSTARDGIFTSTGAMNVTSQNIAGAQTAGYVRRDAQIAPLASGGVGITGVIRNFDRFTYTELNQQRANLASANSRATALANLESLVTPSSDTISDRVSGLFDAIQQLANHPADAAVRSSAVAKAQWVAQGFNDTANNIVSLRHELYTQASDVADSVNQRLSQISDLDRGIIAAQSQGADTSDLRDRRDQLAGEVIERVGGRVVEGGDGSITLFGGNGVLYEGGKPAKLSVILDGGGALKISAERSGSSADITTTIMSGTLGGIREARDVSAPKALALLDSFANDLGNAFNAVHASGFGLDGASGRPLFTDVTSAGTFDLNPDLVGHPERMATSSSSADLPGGNDVAVSMAGLVRASLGGKGTVAERYGELANSVGVQRANADAEQRMREDTVATATALRESASGVSTDEEMVKLQQFQRGFEASSKVLKVVSDLFDTLLNAV